MIQLFTYPSALSGVENAEMLKIERVSVESALTRIRSRASVLQAVVSRPVSGARTISILLPTSHVVFANGIARITVGAVVARVNVALRATSGKGSVAGLVV